ncbi:hypothetical protein AB0C28_04910 [Nonomuraea sp. NPDC048892]|uniref:hypothetical protein n=1 Tax=Nonomuraea sp. NPDC048892 TaxID=3154624 RepID=UPI0033C1D8C7
MLRIVRRSVLTSALAMGVALAAIGLAPASASATPPYALVKFSFNCSRVGPVTVTVKGPGVAGSARRVTGASYFRGRPGLFKIERLANGRIAPKKKYFRITNSSTRRIPVCSTKW